MSLSQEFLNIKLRLGFLRLFDLGRVFGTNSHGFIHRHTMDQSDENACNGVERHVIIVLVLLHVEISFEEFLTFTNEPFFS